VNADVVKLVDTLS